MSDLTPTPRTDKNGKVTIRHMKQNKAAKPYSQEKALPIGVVKAGNSNGSQGPMPIGVVDRSKSSKGPQGPTPIGVVKIGTSKKPSVPLPVGVIKRGTRSELPQGPLPIGVVRTNAGKQGFFSRLIGRKQGD